MFHSLDSNIVPAWGVCAPLLQSCRLYKWTLLLLWLLAPPPAGMQQCDIHGHCCRWDLWKGHFPLHDLRGSSIAIKMRREPLTLATAPSSEEELPRVRPLQNRTEHYVELKSSACRHSMAQRRNMGQITRWFWWLGGFHKLCSHWDLSAAVIRVKHCWEHDKAPEKYWYSYLFFGSYAL